MNNGRNKDVLPTLVSGIIVDKMQCLDNLFADTWKNLKLKAKVLLSGFTKRSGIDVTQAVYLLLLWKWLDVDSIAMFARDSLEVFTGAKKDVMYDLLKREDVNWRELNGQTAKEVYKQSEMVKSRVRAYVLDDSIKGRRGKKMEAVSCHYDHTTGLHVMGQQVLTLGLATEEAFLPLDSQIFVSQVKAHGLINDYKDERSVVAKRYLEATTQSKPEMAKHMLQRAKRRGLIADYVLGDAWFGTKPMISTAIGIGIDGIFRMKKGSMKYRVKVEGTQEALLNAEEIYARFVPQKLAKVRGMPWKAVAIEAELDLGDDEKKSRWTPVKLLFVRGLQEPDEDEVGKKSWALFLTTDMELSMCKILEIYSLRWGIEVYFKEAKQHLGFLKEQTVTFASHTASIHLCAIRYLMLMHNKLEGIACSAAGVRARIQEQLKTLSFAGQLWEMFRGIIYQVFSGSSEMLNCSASELMLQLDEHVKKFIEASLQLDEFTLQLEYE